MLRKDFISGSHNILLILLCCFGTANLEAQLWDTTFVKEFDYQYRVNTGFRIINDLAEFSTSDGKGFSLENKNLAYRIGGRYKFASYTFSIPISDLGTGTDQEAGKGWGLGLRLYRRYGYFRTQFRFTDGFRLTEEEGKSTFRDDIRLFTVYVYAYHLLNAKRFSLRSSFNQRDQQLKSSGSFLLGGLVNRRRLLADNLTIPLSNNERAEVERFAQTNVGIGGGYSYTLIVKKTFFVTPLVYAGPELRFTNLQREGEGRMAETVRVGLQLRSRLSIGYNGTRYFAALIGDYIPNVDNTVTLDTRDLNTQLELRLGVQW